MRNFHIKSILLGIGIGVILTSIISMIYTAGIVQVKMSNQEIIEQAKKLGMVDNTELIKNSSNLVEKQIETSSKGASNIKVDEVKPAASQATKLDTAADEKPETKAAQEIRISISQGESSETVSEKLLKAGLISDKAAFLKVLSEMGLTSEINIGEFNIKKGTEIKAIVNIITGTR